MNEGDKAPASSRWGCESCYAVLVIGSFFILLHAKVSGTVDWSWWMVTTPLWAPLAALAAVLLTLGLLCGIIAVSGGIVGLVRRRYGRTAKDEG